MVNGCFLAKRQSRDARAKPEFSDYVQLVRRSAHAAQLGNCELEGVVQTLPCEKSRPAIGQRRTESESKRWVSCMGADALKTGSVSATIVDLATAVCMVRTLR